MIVSFPDVTTFFGYYQFTTSVPDLQYGTMKFIPVKKAKNTMFRRKYDIIT